MLPKEVEHVHVQLNEDPFLFCRQDPSTQAIFPTPQLMSSIELSDLQTLMGGSLALAIGTLACARSMFPARLDIPSPVLGGVLVALLVAALRAHAAIEVHFATSLSDLFLLMFFTTVGLSAKLTSLKAGGKPLLILCAVTVPMVVVQNLVGIGVALGFGAQPYCGMLVGSNSLVGGPGTAAAWAKEAQAVGLVNAPEVAVACATLAVVAGAVVAGPLNGWFVRRKKLGGSAAPSGAPWVDAKAPVTPKCLVLPIEQVMRTMMLIVGAVLIGDELSTHASSAGMVLPGFLTAMLGGVLITNLTDVFRPKFAFGPIERNGQVALHAFLAMYFANLKLWLIGAAVVPLAVNVALQILLAVFLAFVVLFRLLGRDYDAALTAGGIIGFGLSSMAVGMAPMDRSAARPGPSPKAFLPITLAGSFSMGRANAFLLLPMST